MRNRHSPHSLDSKFRSTFRNNSSHSTNRSNFRNTRNHSNFRNNYRSRSRDKTLHPRKSSDGKQQVVGRVDGSLHNRSFRNTNRNKNFRNKSHNTNHNSFRSKRFRDRKSASQMRAFRSRWQSPVSGSCYTCEEFLQNLMESSAKSKGHGKNGETSRQKQIGKDGNFGENSWVIRTSPSWV